MLVAQWGDEMTGLRVESLGGQLAGKLDVAQAGMMVAPPIVCMVGD